MNTSSSLEMKTSALAAVKNWVDLDGVLLLLAMAAALGCYEREVELDCCAEERGGCGGVVPWRRDCEEELNGRAEERGGRGGERTSIPNTCSRKCLKGGDLTSSKKR